MDTNRFGVTSFNYVGSHCQVAQLESIGSSGVRVSPTGAPTMTMNFYGHVTLDEKRDALNRLGSLFEEER